MKIVLINPPHLESLDPILDPPLGLMYLASIVRTKHEVSIVDLSFHTEINKWKEVIPKADIYGITVMTPSYHHAIRIRDICKEINPNCKVIVGGPHPTALPYETSSDFDIIVVGDGEGIIIDIINYIQKNNSNNNSNDNNNNKSYPKIFYGNDKLMHIDKIPFPARDLVPIKDCTRTVNGNKATSIITSRGCYYRCTFCQNSTKKEKVRFRSVENVINELKDIISKYDIHTFIFYDDTFTLRPDLYILLDEIKKLNIQFRCNGDSRRNEYETFKKLCDAGCKEISFGIESGSQEILDNINKGTNVHKNKIVISNAKKAGLLVKAFLMLGNPGESWDTIKETVKFINETRPDYWTIFTFVPLPGCEIYNNPEKYGIKIIKNGKENNSNWKEYYNIAGQNEGGLVCETKYMTIADIKKARQYMLENLPKQTGPLQDYYSKLKTDTDCNTSMKISIITLVNRPDIYNENVINSTIEQKDKIEYIPIYNAKWATAGLNEGVRKATNEIIICAHQDIFFNPGWYEQFIHCLELLDKYKKNWGVIGMAGTDTEGSLIGTHSGCGMDDRDIAQVQTLDCSTIVLKKSTFEKYGLKFDDNLRFFHGYGEDVSLQSIAKGLSVHVINVNIDHKCKWTAGPGFSESWGYISSKWRKIFPKIYTTVGEH